MKTLKAPVAAAVASILIPVAAAAQRVSSPQPGDAFSAMPATVGSSNLPFKPLGPSDLIRVTVNDSPELSQSFRIDAQGNLNLPLLHGPLAASGLTPDELRDKIAAALQAQHLLVHPVVDVSVVEYRSRDVTIAGAVKTPMTIQELGNLRVLDALSQAGGLLPEAGPEVIVEQPNGIAQRLSVHKLFDGLHPEMNIAVTAGDTIRVPACDQVFVVGNVKRPGAFPFQDLNDTTVLKVLALSGGLDSFSRTTAYIYRSVPGSARKTEIEVPLRRILDRKAQDVKLTANDILYVPTNRKQKTTMSVVDHVTGMGNAAVSAAIWSSH